MTTVQPDRPVRQPTDRVVYLPIRVTWEGLADDTNGPYFKGLLQMSPAQTPTTYSISESMVVTSPEPQPDLNERIALAIEAEKSHVKPGTECWAVALYYIARSAQLARETQ